VRNSSKGALRKMIVGAAPGPMEQTSQIPSCPNHLKKPSRAQFRQKVRHRYVGGMRLKRQKVECRDHLTSSTALLGFTFRAIGPASHPLSRYLEMPPPTSGPLRPCTCSSF
jgi:hypothetical protein